MIEATAGEATVGASVNPLEWEMPKLLVYALLFCIVFSRASATYALGRGLIAGASRVKTTAKMQGQRFGFVKVFCSPSGVVIGGVVVAPGGSELIHALALAVRRRLTVDHVAQAFTVYPSLSGSIAEAARRLHMDRPADCAL